MIWSIFTGVLFFFLKALFAWSSYLISKSFAADSKPKETHGIDVVLRYLKPIGTVAIISFFWGFSFYERTDGETSYFSENSFNVVRSCSAFLILVIPALFGTHKGANLTDEEMTKHQERKRRGRGANRNFGSNDEM
jgi:hypothetical protein